METYLRFPIYMIPAASTIDIIGNVVYIVGFYSNKILDDYSIEGSFLERRLLLYAKYPNNKIYKLKNRLNLFRQLIKCPGNSIIITSDGLINRYKKGNKFCNVKSHKITRVGKNKFGILLYVSKHTEPFFVTALTINSNYISIIETKQGPLMYDITKEYHEPYKRKI